MPKCVPANTLLNSGSHRSRSNYLRQDEIWRKGKTSFCARTCKHPIIGQVMLTFLSPTLELTDDIRSERKRLLGVLGFAFADRLRIDRASDLDGQFLEIDVFPLQAKYFAAAQTGGGCDPDH